MELSSRCNFNFDPRLMSVRVVLFITTVGARISVPLDYLSFNLIPMLKKIL